MNGLEFLLDTNFVRGMMKSDPGAARVLDALNPSAGQSAYSAVTRMELLGFPGITAQEEALIQSRLAKLTYLLIDRTVEDAAIALRRQRRVKLLDALVAATAYIHGLTLLTLDEGLRSAVADWSGYSDLPR